MNSIEYLTKRIMLNIPSEILGLAFKDLLRNNTRSLTSVLSEVIISDIVIVDCNLFSGKVQKIRLLDEWRENVEQPMGSLQDTFTLFRIPPEARDNEDIYYFIDINVDSDFQIDTNFPITGPNNFGYAAMDALHSFTGQGSVVFPRVTLHDGNVVSLSYAHSYGRQWIITVLIGYDKGLTNLKPGMLESLSRMCTAATKRYIYNKLAVSLGQGVITIGKELGPIKDIVDSYADAKAEYDEALMDFRGVSLFDKEQMRLLVHLMRP